MSRSPALGILLILLLKPDNVHSAKLLVTTMDDGKSHAGSFMPFLRKLSKQGHQFTLYYNNYSGRKMFDDKVNETFIDLSEFTCPFGGQEFNKIIWDQNFGTAAQTVAFSFGATGCSRALQTDRTTFDRLTNASVDLIMTDSLFSACGYAIAALNKAHHVMFHSSDVESAHGAMKAFARNYALLPPNFMSYGNLDFDPARFYDRTESTIDWVTSFIGTGIIASYLIQNALQTVLSSFSFVEHNRKSSFSFTDMPEYLYPAGPRTNDYYSYGSYCSTPKQLTGEIRDFVEDETSKGTILIAFGTLIAWESAPKERVENILKTVNRLKDYRVIWAYRGPELQVKSHVRLMSWVPQNELLNHPKTVLFFSHGGLKSVKEAVCSAVPSIFMPMFAEQLRNAWLAKEQGTSQIISKYECTEENLFRTISDVLETPKYKHNAVKLRSRFLDRPISSLEEASQKMDKLLRYKGRMPSYFYPKALELGYLQYLNIDLIVILPFLAFTFVSK